MPTKLCVMPTCANPVRPGKARCDEHMREYERERSTRRRGRAKDALGRSVYRTRIYLMRRKQAFERDPFCAWILRDGERCPRLGEELDHVRPLDQGGPEYDPANLQLLCTEHHRLKTALENSARRSRL
jgi:5-methylcytosine-specific restriction endonuclease McrA